MVGSFKVWRGERGRRPSLRGVNTCFPELFSYNSFYFIHCKSLDIIVCTVCYFSVTIILKFIEKHGYQKLVYFL